MHDGGFGGFDVFEGRILKDGCEKGSHERAGQDVEKCHRRNEKGMTPAEHENKRERKQKHSPVDRQHHRTQCTDVLLGNDGACRVEGGRKEHQPCRCREKAVGCRSPQADDKGPRKGEKGAGELPFSQPFAQDKDAEDGDEQVFQVAQKGRDGGVDRNGDGGIERRGGHEFDRADQQQRLVVVAAQLPVHITTARMGCHQHIPDNGCGKPPEAKLRQTHLIQCSLAEQIHQRAAERGQKSIQVTLPGSFHR